MGEASPQPSQRSREESVDQDWESCEIYEQDQRMTRVAYDVITYVLTAEKCVQIVSKEIDLIKLLNYINQFTSILSINAA